MLLPPILDALAEGEEDVLMAPHHTLGHARGATGVDHVEIVVGTRGEVTLLGLPGHGRLELVGVRERHGRAGAVLDVEQGGGAEGAALGADVVEQLLVRIDDKLSRLARGSAADEDVERDLMGYLVLLRVARKRAAAVVGGAP